MRGLENSLSGYVIYNVFSIRRKEFLIGVIVRERGLGGRNRGREV